MVDSVVIIIDKVFLRVGPARVLINIIIHLALFFSYCQTQTPHVVTYTSQFIVNGFPLSVFPSEICIAVFYRVPKIIKELEELAVPIWKT